MLYYVYILNAVNNSTKFYVGMTENIESRLVVHNSGGSVHTAKNRP